MSHQIASHWTEVLKGQILTFGRSARRSAQATFPSAPGRYRRLPPEKEAAESPDEAGPHVAALEALLESLLQAFALKLPAPRPDQVERINQVRATIDADWFFASAQLSFSLG